MRPTGPRIISSALQVTIARASCRRMGGEGAGRIVLTRSDGQDRPTAGRDLGTTRVLDVASAQIERLSHGLEEEQILFALDLEGDLGLPACYYQLSDTYHVKGRGDAPSPLPVSEESRIGSQQRLVASEGGVSRQQGQVSITTTR